MYVIAGKFPKQIQSSHFITFSEKSKSFSKSALKLMPQLCNINASQRLSPSPLRWDLLVNLDTKKKKFQPSKSWRL